MVATNFTDYMQLVYTYMYYTAVNVQFEIKFIIGEGRMAEWLRYWTLNHEIVGSSPAIH